VHGELGATQRQALRWAYYRGMVHTEIAEAWCAARAPSRLGAAGAGQAQGLLEAAGVRQDSLA